MRGITLIIDEIATEVTHEQWEYLKQLPLRDKTFTPVNTPEGPAVQIEGTIDVLVPRCAGRIRS